MGQWQFDNVWGILLDAPKQAENCPLDMLGRAGFFVASEDTVLTANNTSASVVCFSVIGTIRVLGLIAQLTEATTLNNCTNVYFDFWDGSVPANITANGATISGFEVGSLLLKNADATESIKVIRADQGRIVEPAQTDVKHVLQPFFLNSKTATTCQIRLHYTTTDTPVDATLTVKMLYHAISGAVVTA